MSTVKQQLGEVTGLGGLSTREFGRRVLNEAKQDNVTGYAAQLAYYFLFALFPFLLFLATLLAYIPIPDLLDRIMALVGQVLPAEAMGLIEDNIHTLVTDKRGGLLSFGIIAALWTASSAVAAIMDALNRAYGVAEGRPFWRSRSTAVLLTVAFSLFLSVSMILLMFGPEIGGWIADRVGMGDAFRIAWNILRWPVILLLLIVALAALYYFAPDVEQRWRWITPGSVVAIVGWLLASLAFSFYVNNFGSYNATYGSIGAVIILLTWLYLTGLFILLGGEINSVIEHAARDGKAPGEKHVKASRTA